MNASPEDMTKAKTGDPNLTSSVFSRAEENTETNEAFRVTMLQKVGKSAKGRREGFKKRSYLY